MSIERRRAAASAGLALCVFLYLANLPGSYHPGWTPLVIGAWLSGWLTGSGT